MSDSLPPVVPLLAAATDTFATRAAIFKQVGMHPTQSHTAYSFNGHYFKLGTIRRRILDNTSSDHLFMVYLRNFLYKKG